MGSVDLDDQTILTWTGGPLEADTTGRFSIIVTLPKRTGTLRLPLIQTCTKGNIAWIGPNAKDEHPAPSIILT